MPGYLIQLRGSRFFFFAGVDVVLYFFALDGFTLFEPLLNLKNRHRVKIIENNCMYVLPKVIYGAYIPIMFAKHKQVKLFCK